MPTKRRATKRKPAKRKATGRKTSGLAKYRAAIKKATRATDKAISGLESRLKKAKRLKAAKTKKAAAAYRRKNK